MAFDPTPEQLAAVAAAKTGENLVITAGAGSGKTSTLKLIADALAPRKGIYIAYNKAIATDAQKAFPKNVECRTAHSFAYRAIGHAYQTRLKSTRVTGRQLADLLGIDRSYPLPANRELAPQRVAGAIMATINQWCRSADAKIMPRHVPEVPGTEDISYDFSVQIAEHAQRVWEEDLCHTTPTYSAEVFDRRTKRTSIVYVPFSHDMYVKLWALSNPKLQADFILYDEAQDADPCIAGIVLAQKSSQLIAVGDECQAIYGWRGATDAMKNWPAQQRVSLSKSFRFGPAVAEQANVFLEKLQAPLRIEGYEAKTSQVGMVDLIDADAVLCRTNAGVIATALSIHYARQVYIVGGSEPIRKFAEAAAQLMDGRRAPWHADLGAFDNWADVLDYVNNDAAGGDIRSMVNIIENFGVETIMEVCDKAASGKEPPKGALVLSTAHKAKGREWDRVVIHTDFIPQTDPETGETRQPSRMDLMLMYVAVTRAKTHLDCAALAWAA